MSETKHNETKHKSDCAMAFGRKDPSCPRCQELLNGATPRKAWGWRNKQYEARKLVAIRSHDFAACATKNVQCTCFDW